MKFQCDRCQTRYSIGEEKIRGKVLKIRCKNCSAVITVREGNASTSGPDAEKPAGATPGKDTGAQKSVGKPVAGDKGSTIGKAPTAAQPNAPANGAGRGKAPVLEAAFDRAMARPSAAMPAVAGSAADRNATIQESDEASTKMGPPPEAAADIEWFVSIDGDQEGPFTLPEARRRVGKKKADEEMFAWQEGFDDWLPIEKVPELAPHLPTSKPARPLGAPAIPGDAGRNKGVVPMAAAPSKSGPLFGPTPAASSSSSSSSDESPFSLAALQSSSSSSSDDNENDNSDPSNDNYDFDIGEASRVVKLPMLVPPPRGDAAGPAPTRRTAAVNLPGMAQARGTGAQPTVGGQVLGPDANPAAQILAPRPRKKHGVFFFAGIGAFVMIVVALVFVLMQTNKPSEFAAGSGGYNTDQLFADLYKTETQEEAKKIADIVGPVLQPGGRGPQAKRPKVGQDTVKQPAVRERTYDEFGNPTGSSGPRQADDILNKSRSEGGALKQCWERALKTDPELKSGGGIRLEVNIVIKADGSMRNVSVASPRASASLRKCVSDRVGSWKLPLASNDLPMQFPIVFQ